MPGRTSHADISTEFYNIQAKDSRLTSLRAKVGGYLEQARPRNNYGTIHVYIYRYMHIHRLVIYSTSNINPIVLLI